MSWKQYITGAAICVAVGYILYRIIIKDNDLKEKSQSASIRDFSANNPSYSAKKPTNHESEQVIVTSDDKIPSDRVENINNKAKEEFIGSCRNFHGSYELLYDICYSEVKDSLKLKYLQKWEKLIKMNKLNALTILWEETIKNCSEDELKSLADVSPDNLRLNEIACRWLDRLKEWGIERKKEEKFIIDVNSTIYYDIDDMYEFGNQAQVIEKCWVLSKDEQGNTLKESIIVEKGLAKLSKE